MLTEGFDFLYIIFELTLFLLLTIVLYQLIKDYLAPYLYAEIENIKKTQQDLSDKKYLLLKSEKKVKKEIIEQRYTFDFIENKVKVWKYSLSKENDQENLFNKNLLRKIKNKRIIQSTNLRLLKTEREIIPVAVKQAYKEISDLYSGEKSRALLKELIEKIEPDN